MKRGKRVVGVMKFRGGRGIVKRTHGFSSSEMNIVLRKVGLTVNQENLARRGKGGFGV